MSPEDKLLLEGLELAVTRTKDTDPGIVSTALEHLATEIKNDTASMTSVPKPLKFLRPHYDHLKVRGRSEIDFDSILILRQTI